MSRKRRNTSSPEPDDTPSPPGWNLGQDEDDLDLLESTERPQVDPYTGQAGAFPGLTGDDDDAPRSHGPASNGLEYLRMVRFEAQGVPQVLTAQGERLPSTHGHDELTVDDDAGGYYYDGAYTARPVAAENTNLVPLPLPQRRYYDSLLAQFRLVQATMRCTPPLAAVGALGPSHLISFPPESRGAREQWEEHIRHMDPHPVQIACMDAESVLELVKFLKRKLGLLLRDADPQLRARLGAWIWATLGKCRDQGELSSEEVGELRALAQRAANMLSENDQGHTDQDDAGADHGSTTAEPYSPNEYAEISISLGHRKAITRAGPLDATEGVHREATKTTPDDRSDLLGMILEMIVTVVGELYGQRDLLELRPAWQKD